MAHSKPRNSSTAGPAASGGLRIVPQRKGTETTLTIEREDSISPSKSFFADYVRVEDNLNDVTMIFGKLRPKIFTKTPELRFAIEVSFPHRRFCDQFDTLVRQPENEETPFLEAVQQAVGRQLPESTGETDHVPTLTDSKEFGGLRANAAFLYLQDDEACIDFFYLDAATMHGMRRGSGPTRIPGLLRILLTPSVLLTFLNRCTAVATQIRNSPQYISAVER